MKLFQAVRRNYHGEEAECMIRWVVVLEGETRGVCECWNEDEALEVVKALNDQICEVLTPGDLLEELRRMFRQIKRSEKGFMGGENYYPALSTSDVDSMAALLEGVGK